MPITTAERFQRAVSIMARLRAPGGCPWDREQTFDSIKPYTLEETYEVLEAIDNRDWDELPGETARSAPGQALAGVDLSEEGLRFRSAAIFQLFESIPVAISVVAVGTVQPESL